MMTMTLLELSEALCLNVGMIPPIQIIGSSSRQGQEILETANEAGLELARRVNWGVLTEITTFTGVGTSASFALPANFMRMTASAGARWGTRVLRPITRSEWNTVQNISGNPRFYHISASNISFWPYLGSGVTVNIRYQSDEWASSGAQFLADDATPLVPSDLMVKGMIVRWRRQKGMSYADEEAEYEAALIDYAAAEDGGRL